MYLVLFNAPVLAVFGSEPHVKVFVRLLARLISLVALKHSVVEEKCVACESRRQNFVPTEPSRPRDC